MTAQILQEELVKEIGVIFRDDLFKDSAGEYIKMVCWICLYFSPPFQSTRTARYSSHRRSGCHRPATPQCSSQCIRDRRCRCRSACSVCIFRRSSFVLLSSTGFLFLYILIITLLVAKVKFFPKKFCQKKLEVAKRRGLTTLAVLHFHRSSILLNRLSYI